MKTEIKDILTLYLSGLLALTLLFWFFSRDQLKLYTSKSQINENIPCEEIIQNYSIGGLSNIGEYSFQDWQYCIAKQNYSLHSNLIVWLLPVVVVLLVLIVLSRRVRIKMRKRTIILLLISPFTFYVLFGLLKNIYFYFVRPETIDPEVGSTTFLIFFIMILVFFSKIIVYSIKKINLFLNSRR